MTKFPAAQEVKGLSDLSCKRGDKLTIATASENMGAWNYTFLTSTTSGGGPRAQQIWEESQDDTILTTIFYFIIDIIFYNNSLMLTRLNKFPLHENFSYVIPVLNQK